MFEQGGVIEKKHQMIGRQAMSDFPARFFDCRMIQIRQEAWWKPVPGFQLLFNIRR
ncbi:hypothetical protein D3C84_1133280 [compost metagenome]